VIVVRRSKLQQAFSAHRGRWRALADSYQFITDLRSRRFDIAIDFQGNAKSGLFTYMSGARLRVGFDRRNSREANTFFTNQRVSLVDSHINRAEKYLALARAVGGSPESVEAVLPTWPAEAKTATAFLREAGLPRPLIALHPGTSEFGAYKRWPAEHYGQLARRLMRRLKSSILVTWGPREHPMAEKVASAAGRDAVLSPPTHNIRELAEIIRQMDLFISADTGPMHIAAALGVPVIALFGPKDPILHGPYGKHTRVVRADLHCSPCSKRACDDPKCMTGITVDMVMTAAKDLLASSGHRRAQTCHSTSSSWSPPHPEKKVSR
jgi:lipopolysaccharide heptosyltransferase II